MKLKWQHKSKMTSWMSKHDKKPTKNNKIIILDFPMFAVRRPKIFLKWNYEMLYFLLLQHYTHTHISQKCVKGTTTTRTKNQKPTTAKSQVKPTAKAKSQKSSETKAKIKSHKPKAKSQVSMQMKDFSPKIQQIERITAPQTKKHKKK